MALCTYGFSQATYELKVESIAQIEQVEEIQQNVDISALNNMLGTVYQSDIEFKAALAETIGTDAARDFESHFLKTASNMNAILILVGILGFVASFACPWDR